MLEHSPLLIHAWARKANTEAGPAWVRPITDAAGCALGFVRFDGEANVSWLSWLRRMRLEVFETDDASHLMTLTRSWGILGSWEVEDAENRQVGSLYAKTMVTSENLRLGYLNCGTKGDGTVVDVQRLVRARFSRKEGVILEVAITPEPSANPFVRMLVLASILTLEPTPNSRI